MEEKTADEMFEELGYKIDGQETKLEVEYINDDKKIIYFDKYRKVILSYNEYDENAEELTLQDLQAINKKCMELRLAMMNKCKYLTIRSKNYEKYFYCRLNKKIINYTTECVKCVKSEPRKNKGINKVSKKRITVKEETYNKVMQRDNYKCVMLNYECKGKIELHHVRYRSERKDLINEPNNCVCLCTFHHKLVHSNKKKYQPILLKILENK